MQEGENYHTVDEDKEKERPGENYTRKEDRCRVTDFQNYKAAQLNRDKSEIEIYIYLKTKQKQS